MISKELAGPVGLFVKFSVLQEYGVDRVFLLENDNVDSSQRNVIFLASGEKAGQVKSTAGMYFDCMYSNQMNLSCLLLCIPSSFGPRLGHHCDSGTQSRLHRHFLLCVVSLVPNIEICEIDSQRIPMASSFEHHH